MTKNILIAIMSLLVSQFALANGFYVGAQGVYSAMQEDDIDPGIAYGGKAGYNMNRMNLGLHVLYTPLDEDMNEANVEASDLFAVASADFYLVEGLFVSGKAGMVNRTMEIGAVEVDSLALAYGGGVGYSIGVNKNFSIDFEANYLVAAESEADLEVGNTTTTVDLDETDYINGGVTLRFMF